MARVRTRVQQLTLQQTTICLHGPDWSASGIRLYTADASSDAVVLQDHSNSIYRGLSVLKNVYFWCSSCDEQARTISKALRRGGS